MQKISQVTLAVVVLSMLGACSQARRGLGSRNGEANIWSAQRLCSVPAPLDLYGCFDVALNVTDNTAIVSVLQLGFDPQRIPYRIMVVSKGESFTLANNITTPAGEEIEVAAPSGHQISEFTEWHIELTLKTTNNIDYYAVSPRFGTPVAHAVLKWPEQKALSASGNR